MMRPLVSIALGMLLLTPAAASAADAHATMRQVGATYAEAMRGVVAYRIVGVTAVRAPMMDKDMRFEGWHVSQNGDPVRIVLSELSTQGKAASDKERQEAEKKMNTDLQAGKMRFFAPYDPRYASDYTFADAGPNTIKFTSRVRDDRHGDGTLVLDKRGALVQATVVPAKSRANVEGSTLYTFGPSGPDGAVVLTQVKLSYKGAMGPLKGSFEMNQSQAQYRRFGSVEAALAKLGR